MDPLKEVKEKMGVLIQFVLDNMKNEASRATQAEFNFLYSEYGRALGRARDNGISEEMAMRMKTKSPVEVPDHLMDEFEAWFDDRVDSMVRTEVRNTKELN